MEIKCTVVISINKKYNMGVSNNRDKPVIIWELTLQKDGDKWTALLYRTQISYQALKEDVFTIYQIILFFEMLKPSVNRFWAQLFGFQTFSSWTAEEL